MQVRQRDCKRYRECARAREKEKRKNKPGFLISSHVDDFLSCLRKQRPLCKHCIYLNSVQSQLFVYFTILCAKEITQSGIKQKSNK